MKKPSIFSKDYEKIMRKRKRKRIVIGILSICIIGILVTEVANYDFDAFDLLHYEHQDFSEKQLFALKCFGITFLVSALLIAGICFWI